MNQDFEGSKSDREIVSVISSRQRLAKLSNITVVVALLGIFICPIYGCMRWERNPVVGVTFVSLTVVCVLICVFLGKSVRKQEAKIKELTGQYIVKGVLAEKIDIIEYSPNYFINEKFIKKCAILPNYNKIKGSDYISGNYRGRKMVYCDLLLEWESRERDSDGHRRTRTTTLFHGHLMKMELGKDIGGFVRIKERKNPRKSNSFFANILGMGTSPNDIETENVAFNNQFEIKTSDAQLAFYILTPQFMESVMRLDELADGYMNMEFMRECGIIFLDINMDGMDGLEAARQIKAECPKVHIVLVTAYVNYALDGYKVKASRFLLKDDLEQTLQECMDDILREIRQEERVVEFGFVEGNIRLKVDDIIYIETSKHKNVFYTKEQTFSIYKKMDELEDDLKGMGFVRIHQSFLINMKYIEKISNYVMILTTGKEISVPKSRYPEVKRQYTLFKGAE